MTRQQVLESFLNTDVIEIQKGLYSWRGIMFEVLPYKEILKDKKRKPDHFIKVCEKGIWYGLRELSDKTLKKFYPIDK